MNKFEQSGLRTSLIGAFVFALLGISFAVITNSQAVLLDGAFNLITGVMGLFAMRITKLLDVPLSKRLPAGYVALEPFYILIKGLILLVLTLFVLTSNVIIMLRGGSNLKLGVIIIYIGISVIGNLIIYLLINNKLSKVKSPMLMVERENWMVNTLISSGIGLSFLLVFLFKDGVLKPLIPYIDQIVVIIVGLFTISVPVKAIRDGMRELLLVGPPDEIRSKVQSLLSLSLSGEEISSWQVSVLKTGRKLWITLFLSPSVNPIDISFSDRIRDTVSAKMKNEFPANNVDVIITRQPENLGIKKA